MIEKKWFDRLVWLLETVTGYGVVFDDAGRVTGLCRLDVMLEK